LMRGAHASGQDASSANDRFPAVKLSIAGELNSRRTGMAGSCPKPNFKLPKCQPDSGH
jgi:hypothetical protein